MTDLVVIGLTVLGLALGLGFGYLLARLTIARRQEREGTSAEDAVAEARLEAKTILATAEEEGRAKAEAYRERGGPTNASNCPTWSRVWASVRRLSNSAHPISLNVSRSSSIARTR